MKCNLVDHEEIDAISYCIECKVYMCNKCEIFHSKLCKKHHCHNIDKNIKEIFTGFCKEEDHLEILEFFCKDHNQLCCSSCIIKIKRGNKGKHSNCNICNIEEIKDEKKNKLKENIKNLENLLNTIEESLDKLKNIYEKISVEKEELKSKIQKFYTKIRNKINEREDELLMEIDNYFDDLYFKEDIIKQSKKLPNQIKISLEKSKLIENEWNDNSKLNSIINDCLVIENNINFINMINEKVKKCNNEKIQLSFIPEEKQDNLIKQFYSELKNNMNISYNKISYKFKECPTNIKDRKYILDKKENIITRVGKGDNIIAVICENKLDECRVYKWKIKILKSKNKYINVGVTPIDLDINSEKPYKYGWYLYCYDSSLYSGPPHKYNGKNVNLKEVKEEIIVVFNVPKKSLKFIIDGEDNGESYTNIPIDKPLIPIVTLGEENDSVQLIDC